MVVDYLGAKAVRTLFTGEYPASNGEGYFVVAEVSTFKQAKADPIGVAFHLSRAEVEDFGKRAKYLKETGALSLSLGLRTKESFWLFKEGAGVKEGYPEPTAVVGGEGKVYFTEAVSWTGVLSAEATVESLQAAFESKAFVVIIAISDDFAKTVKAGNYKALKAW